MDDRFSEDPESPPPDVGKDETLHRLFIKATGSGHARDLVKSGSRADVGIKTASG
jgi:hypothetical protein